MELLMYIICALSLGINIALCFGLRWSLQASSQIKDLIEKKGQQIMRSIPDAYFSYDRSNSGKLYRKEKNEH